MSSDDRDSGMHHVICVNDKLLLKITNFNVARRKCPLTQYRLLFCLKLTCQSASAYRGRYNLTGHGRANHGSINSLSLSENTLSWSLHMILNEEKLYD